MLQSDSAGFGRSAFIQPQSATGHRVTEQRPRAPKWPLRLPSYFLYKLAQTSYAPDRLRFWDPAGPGFAAAPASCHFSGASWVQPFLMRL
jgi:hypothetical protein